MIKSTLSDIDLGKILYSVALEKILNVNEILCESYKLMILKIINNTGKIS